MEYFILRGGCATKAIETFKTFLREGKLYFRKILIAHLRATCIITCINNLRSYYISLLMHGNALAIHQCVSVVISPRRCASADAVHVSENSPARYKRKDNDRIHESFLSSSKFSAVNRRPAAVAFPTFSFLTRFSRRAFLSASIIIIIIIIKDDNVDCASARCPEVLSSAPRHATTLNMTARRDERRRREGRSEVACRAAISCPVTRFQVLTPSTS